jgi:hypothetical protein
MVVLRPTRKLFRDLPPSSELTAESDTALGDWYVNRLVVDRRPLLLLVSSALSSPWLFRRATSGAAWPAADTYREPAAPPGCPREACTGRARSHGARCCRAHQRQISNGHGCRFCQEHPYYLEIGGWDETTLSLVEARLAETPVTRPGASRRSYSRGGRPQTAGSAVACCWQLEADGAAAAW